MDQLEIATRNLRDFLQLYNNMTATCFNACVTSMNTGVLDDYETACVESCASKFIKANRKIMQLYIVYQQALNMKRMDEMQVQSNVTEDQDQK